MRQKVIHIIKKATHKVLGTRNSALNDDRFRQQLERFRELSEGDGRFVVREEDLFPCLSDATRETAFDAHYVYHPAWAARILADNRPAVHVDIGSTLHFCATVSAFIPMRFYDYRPASLNLSGLECEKADLLELPFDDDSVESLSCMHTLEHVGLGRYGDELDPSGDLKAIAELVRVLAPGGNLLVAVPISGDPRIQFNAHRIYSYSQILEVFSGLELAGFDLIPDDAERKGMMFEASEADADRQRYGCGCFLFKKEQRDT
jgi:SAM-dependent methyltransferase